MTAPQDYVEITVTQDELSQISDADVDRMWDLIESAEQKGLIKRVEREIDGSLMNYRSLTVRLYGDLSAINAHMLLEQKALSQVRSPDTILAS